MAEQKLQQYDWDFPVRVETSQGIVWRKNIIEVFAALKKPIDELGWRQLTSTGQIAAKGYNHHLLESLWDEGWQDLAICPPKARNNKNKIVFRLRETKFGRVLDTIYGSAAMMCKHNNLEERQAIMVLAGEKFIEDYVFLPLYGPRTRDKERPWTVFDAENYIIGHYGTLFEVYRYTGHSPGRSKYAMSDCYNQYKNGDWLWNDNWGLIPISPLDEVLPTDWRVSRRRTDREANALFVNSGDIPDQS